MTTFFTIPSMGVHPDQATRYRKDAEDIFAFLSEGYGPQPFPGKIDFESARRGFDTFREQCAECHGTYEWSGERPGLILFPNWIGDAGTDPLRAQSFTPALADAVGETSYGETIAAVSTGLYAAPPLAGIWASAPYLHNGSVPTVEAVLTPALRPKRFMLGGHALDFVQLGIRLTGEGAYPGGYTPFSEPVWFDTSTTGQTNGGHLYGSGLETATKKDLIEFLKLL